MGCIKTRKTKVIKITFKAIGMLNSSGLDSDPKSSGYLVCISGIQATRIRRCSSLALVAAATKPTTD